MSDIASKTEDHALEAVPIEDRQSVWQLSWNTAGIATTLVALFVGALVTFATGIKIGVGAGFIVCLLSGTLGWGMGHIACKTGLSSSVLARLYGFGEKGALIVALTFGFLIIGFIALENVMIYKGLVFWFNLTDSNTNRGIIYSCLTVLWIVLAAFGFRFVTKIASITVVCFFLTLAYIAFEVIGKSSLPFSELSTFSSLFSADTLRAMNIESDSAKFAFCVNIMVGFAGAAAMINADFGRYGKRSSDTCIASYIGSFFLTVLMVFIGGIIMYAGSQQIIDYHIAHGMAADAARAVVLESPDAIAAAFIIFGGALGGFLMIAAQSKIQVINSYSASLALTSFFDSVFGWKPGRLVFLIVANLLACLMIYGNILHFFESFMTIFGVLTTCFAMIILVDYFWISKLRNRQPLKVNVNWPAIFSVIFSFVCAHYVLIKIIPIEFFTSSIATMISYPVFYKVQDMMHKKPF